MPTLAIATDTVSEFAEDVRAGLTKTGQKELLSKHLYDAVGSALFEVISLLPEYGLTRADERILRRYADEITGRIASPLVVAEVSSGSGRKTRCILEAVARRQPTMYQPTVISTPTSICPDSSMSHGTIPPNAASKCTCGRPRFHTRLSARLSSPLRSGKMRRSGRKAATNSASGKYPRLGGAPGSAAMAS